MAKNVARQQGNGAVESTPPTNPQKAKEDIPQARALFSGPEGLRPYRKKVIAQRPVGVTAISPNLRTELETSFQDPTTCNCPQRCFRWVGEIGWWHTIPDCPYTNERLKPFQYPKRER